MHSGRLDSYIQLPDDDFRLPLSALTCNAASGCCAIVRQVRQVLGPLWHAYPTAEAMAEADPLVVESIIRPLGLQVT